MYLLSPGGAIAARADRVQGAAVIIVSYCGPTGIAFHYIAILGFLVITRDITDT